MAFITLLVTVTVSVKQKILVLLKSVKNVDITVKSNITIFFKFRNIKLNYTAFPIL